MPIGIEFQRRYATIVLELEQLNKDLNKVLHKVQQYCYEVGGVYQVPLRGLWPLSYLKLILLPSHLRKPKLSQDLWAEPYFIYFFFPYSINIEECFIHSDLSILLVFCLNYKWLYLSKNLETSRKIITLNSTTTKTLFLFIS